MTRPASRGLIARFLLILLLGVFVGALGAPLAPAGSAVAKSPVPKYDQVAQAATTAPASAPDASAASDPAATLDAVKQSLDQIDAKLANDTMSDAELVKLRASLDPISAQIQGVIGDVQPKLAAVKARLDQLGQPPDPKANPPAAPEDPAVTQERADQQKLFSARDDLLKRANVSQLRVDQIAAAIADQRRTLFTNSVFQTASSIAAPSLWMDVARDVPHNLSAARGALMDFVDQSGRALASGSALLFALAVIALIGLVVAAAVLARRVIPREKSGRPPTELQK
ncbi:DUF3772 domain-containing protein, partial [Rhodoblastus sp.]|uniref:DUF3772 domain-containing protein n=1 Tax=Rhodoblastus sp. TaxID=1962975 RepID=UPI0035AD8DE3